MKRVILLILHFSCAVYCVAQSQADLNRLDFAKAEEAYSLAKFDEALGYLESIENRLGGTNQLILHLKIKSKYRTGQFDFKELLESYLSIPEEKGTDRYLEILMIKDELGVRLKSKKEIEQLWKEAEINNTIKTYEDFLNQIPYSEYHAIAQSKLTELRNIENEKILQKKKIEEEDKVYNDAISKKTIEAYEKYARLYPNGRYIHIIKPGITGYYQKKKQQEYEKLILESEEYWSRAMSSSSRGDWNLGGGLVFSALGAYLIYDSVEKLGTNDENYNWIWGTLSGAVGVAMLASVSQHYQTARKLREKSKQKKNEAQQFKVSFTPSINFHPINNAYVMSINVRF